MKILDAIGRACPGRAGLRDAGNTITVSALIIGLSDGGDDIWLEGSDIPPERI